MINGYKLTDYIKKRRGELGLRSESKLISLADFVHNLYYPSIYGALAVAMVLIGVYLSLHYLKDIFFTLFQQCFEFSGINLTKVTDQLASYYLGIHAGIAAVIVALLIFVAEGFREDRIRGQCFLKVSYLFPITIAILFAFIRFVVSDKFNYLEGFVSVVIALLVVRATGVIFYTLLNTKYYNKHRVLLILDSIKRSIQSVINERIANHYIIEGLRADGFKIEYSFLSKNDEEHYIFYAQSRGVIADINLKKLSNFANEVEAVVQKNYLKVSVSNKSTANADVTSGQVSVRDVQCDVACNINVLFHDNVDDGSNEKSASGNSHRRPLLSINKRVIGILSNKDLLEFKKITNSIFDIRPGIESVHDELHENFSIIGDYALTIIQSGRFHELDAVINLYCEIAEELLKIMKDNNIIFDSAEIAKKERNNIFDNWEVLKTVSMTTEKLFNAAITTQNFDIVTHVSRLPFWIARTAYDYGDHFLFQDFMKFVKHLYLGSLKSTNADVADYLFDRSWRVLREFVLYRIGKEGRVNNIAYIEYCIALLQDLIKESLDRGNEKHFEAYCRTLFQFKNGEFAELSAGSLGGVGSKCEPEDEVFYGITSYMLAKWREGMIMNSYFEIIHRYLPKNIKVLTNLFIQCHDDEAEKRWGWSWWESQPEGGVHRIYVRERLEAVYVFLLIQLLATGKTDVIPPSRGLVSAKNKKEGLAEIANAIKTNRAEWQTIVPDAKISFVDDVLRLLERAEQVQEQAEEAALKEQDISSSLVESIKNAFILEYEKGATMRTIFKSNNIFNDKTSVPAPFGMRWLGINSVEDKDLFIENTAVHYIGVGESFGHSIAAGENIDIFNKLSQKTQEVSVRNLDDLIAAEGKLENFVIVINDINIFEKLINTANFTPSWRLEKPTNLYGIYKFEDVEIPVYHCEQGANKEMVMLLDKSRIGRMVQYSPLKEGVFNELTGRNFLFEIKSYSHSSETKKQFLDKPPAWFYTADGVGTGADSITIDDYLNRKVSLKIIEYFVIELGDESYGKKIIS